jgi:hypothetical protein
MDKFLNVFKNNKDEKESSYGRSPGRSPNRAHDRRNGEKYPT